ncbi:plectin-like isoform X2 [Arapaima gigas]
MAPSTDWVISDPTAACFSWVLVLVLATLLLWAVFFCCTSRTGDPEPLWERLCSDVTKPSKKKVPGQVRIS